MIAFPPPSAAPACAGDSHVAGLNDLFAIVSRCCPRAAVTFKGVIAAGDAIAVRWAAHEILPDGVLSISPHAARPPRRGVAVARIACDRVAEYWLSDESPDLWQRLGSLLAPRDRSA